MFLKEEEIVRYSNGWNALSCKTQIKKIKDNYTKKKEATKEEAPVASTSKPQANPFPQEGKKNNSKNLDGIQEKGEEKNETTSFPKEITLSSDVVNTLTKIKNSILPLKEIKNILLSSQEIYNDLSSVTKIAEQNKKEIENIQFIVENNKSKGLIENAQKLIQGQQELYKYINNIKVKALTMNYDVSIDNLTEKLKEMTISVEKLLLDHVEKSDEAIMNLKDDILNEIRLITGKMDKINKANINMPKLSAPFSHTRSPVKPKEESTNSFITDLRYQYNDQVLKEEAPQLKELSIFIREGEYDHMSFIKTIEMLQEDYDIPDELITSRLHSLFEKSAKIWYYGIRQTNCKNMWSW
ncbi:hypothetical protein O181_068222 [Austropuccinia psidii MF-1]|uniref:Uncharacterized protein n=1 Tax=Austropuccinia psidii MF-1 TaxID=1389203 RepID=A0A9Q3I625_9BASI|nr:hypothetical protein [Austropuccinia psidii MF-1]